MRLTPDLSRWMRRFRDAESRLQYGAIGFVFLVCLVVIAVEAANLWDRRAEQMNDAWQDAANLARSLAQHAEDTVRTADVSIIGIAHRLQMDGTAPEKLDQLMRIMAARLSMSPMLADQVIIEASGRCTAAPHSLSTADCHASFQENLEFHRTHAADEPHLGRPMRDVASGSGRSRYRVALTKPTAVLPVSSLPASAPTTSAPSMRV